MTGTATVLDLRAHYDELSCEQKQWKRLLINLCRDFVLVLKGKRNVAFRIRLTVVKARFIGRS